MSAGTGTALCAWGELFTLSCPGEGGPHGAPASQPGATDLEGDGARATLRIECTAKGIFAPSYGRAVVPFGLLVPAGFDRDAMLDAHGETAVQTLHVPLQRSRALFGSGAAGALVAPGQTATPDEQQVCRSSPSPPLHRTILPPLAPRHPP